MNDTDQRPSSVRIDKWLWAARFFKTRSNAAEAIDGGKVHWNGSRVKRGRMVHVGDRVRIRKGPYEYHVVVTGLGEKRGSVEAASGLYDETSESIKARERLQEQLRLAAAATPTAQLKGRPTKRDRRKIRQFKEQS